MDAELPEEGTNQTDPKESRSSQKRAPRAYIPLIALGASAGGIEAFEAFFRNLPTQTGMAFVVIQHLDPNHDSILAELIQRFTEMRVEKVQNDVLIEANCVYVIPPNAMMGIFEEHLQLLEPTSEMKLRLPIDFFFRSMADELQERAVGIIFSRTGSDGTLGLKAIKGSGGMIMVQDPESAAYDGMPHSAISTGLVDVIASPEEMPERLTRYMKYTMDKHTQPVNQLKDDASESLRKILMLIRTQTGHDFSHYKESTVRRRIERLMAINQLDQMPAYVRFLQNNTIGVEALFRDLLIGVTSFFRDNDVFASLQEKVIPQLFENRRSDQIIRIWVPACSTGEEAYSIAILMREHMDFLNQEFRVQIFATDIDSNAVNFARVGMYPANITLDVPEKYLKRYFHLTNDGYHINKSLRDLVIFAPHSVTKDPPFSKIDLISCRNLLIYLDSELQYKVLSYLRFGLNPLGFLLLGSSESLGKNDIEFKVIDAQHKLFQYSGGGINSRFMMDARSIFRNVPTLDEEGIKPKPAVSLREITEGLLLKEWTPACVVINQQGQIRYVHGRTGKYLEIISGEVDKLDIIRSARDGLKVPLTTAIYRAITRKQEIIERSIRVKTNGDETIINLIVRPVDAATLDEVLYAVLFEEVDIDERGETGSKEIITSAGDEREKKYLLLQQELNDTREYLQATIEELKSSNEEMQSMNEELQSVNEELETSQEELRAVNEELMTINSELEQKIEELTWANNDLSNTLNIVQTGIVLLDTNFQIRRFNPAATKIFKLIDGDIGRSITHVVSDLNYERLLDDVELVFNTLVPVESDVQTKSGQWYAMHIRPYRTSQNAIKGVVITFIDITLRMETERIQTAQILAESVLNTVREPLLLLDSLLRVVDANQSFYRTFQVSEEDSHDKLLVELGDGQWQIPELISLLQTVATFNSPFEDYEVVHSFPTIGTRKMMLNGRQVLSQPDQPLLILLAIEDVTDRD